MRNGGLIAVGPPNLARRFLGVRLSAPVETILFLSLALLFDFSFLDGNRFEEWKFHPFWIIVLLVASYYGTNEGLAAALLSSIALIAWNIPVQSFSEDRSAWLMRISVLPVLWFLAAMIFGEIRSGLQRRLDSLNAKVSETKNQLNVIAEAYEQVAETNKLQEIQIAAHTRTVGLVYHASRMIERLGSGEVLIGAMEFTRLIMQPNKYSLFLLNGAVLEACECEGWEIDDSFSRCIEAKSALFQAVVNRRQILSVADPAQEVILSGQGLFAGPIMKKETGEVLGMLKIEDIRLQSLQRAALYDFQLVCDWIGVAYSRAALMEDTAENSNGSLYTNIVSADAFRRKCGKLVTLAQRMGFNTNALYMQVQYLDATNMDDNSSAARAIARVANELVPVAGLLFEIQSEEWDCVLLFSGLDAVTVEAIAQEICGEVCNLFAEDGYKVESNFMIERLYAVDDDFNLVFGKKRCVS